MSLAEEDEKYQRPEPAEHQIRSVSTQSAQLFRSLENTTWERTWEGERGRSRPGRYIKYLLYVCNDSAPIKKKGTLGNASNLSDKFPKDSIIKTNFDICTCDNSWVYEHDWRCTNSISKLNLLREKKHLSCLSETFPWISSTCSWMNQFKTPKSKICNAKMLY